MKIETLHSITQGGTLLTAGGVVVEAVAQSPVTVLQVVLGFLTVVGQIWLSYRQKKVKAKTKVRRDDTDNQNGDR